MKVLLTLQWHHCCACQWYATTVGTKVDQLSIPT